MNMSYKYNSSLALYDSWELQIILDILASGMQMPQKDDLQSFLGMISSRKYPSICSNSHVTWNIMREKSETFAIMWTTSCHCILTNGCYSSPLNFSLSPLVKTDHVVRSRAGTICHYSSPLNFSLSSLVKTDHVVRSCAGTVCQWNALGRLSDDIARSAEVAHQRQLSPAVFFR